MTEQSAYSVSPLLEGEFILYRRADYDLAPTLLVAAADDSPGSLKHLEHQYALRADLDATWAARPIGLIRREARPTLVLEDPGGEPLERLLDGPLEIAPFLRIAVPLAAAIRQMHARGLIHKDLKPANVLVDVASGGVWLTGFGVASRLPRERQALAPPEVIAGTIAYMAPEQTGRMNRSIDSRSDLYALGVILYQTLTGGLPFTASDPLEWIHCHIARQPVSPSERENAVPAQLSAIVMKLLAKTPEERYQTAAGVEADLRRCLSAWETHRRIDRFPLAARDVSDRLVIAERLYGREAEIDTLLAAFDRVLTHGTTEFVLVSGYSGIGKSSIVNELHKVVPPCGLFAAGKFDQYKRDIPYATLAQAFQSLVRQLLSTDDAELNLWRNALLEALGPNGQLMINLIPELALVIGEQPPVPDLAPQDRQKRFQLVFRRLLSVFARPEHPLALFLDDLQWMDAATLELIGHLVTEPEVQHLMLVGAYRDNEIDPSHPLMRTLETIREAGGSVQEIVVTPLRPDDIGQLIADSVHCEREIAQPLAQLVHEKTAGNPFFAVQFLMALAEETLLVFDHGAAAWTWNLPAIHARGFTDNVADLMAAKLGQLPDVTKEALGQLACLGNVAQIATITVAYGESEQKVHEGLWEAVRTGLVFRSGDAYAFVHDRVQEAAYALIPESERAATHLRIGRALASRAAPGELEEAIFDFVNHLNRGAERITTRKEREQVAELNLMAGKRAKNASAYSSALKYLTAGTDLMAEDCWERLYDLAFALELHRAECEFLIGDLAAAEERLLRLSRRTRSLADETAVACLRMDLYTLLIHNDSAVAVCLEYLRRVGIEWSPHPRNEDVWQEYERIWRQLGDRSIEELIDLPLMNDSATRATMDVLTKLMPPAFMSDENLACLMSARMVNLSLEYGNGNASCCGYVWFGMILGSYFGDYSSAFRFSQLSVDLVNKRGLDAFMARVYMNFGNGNTWTQNIRSSCTFLQRALDEANRVGDLVYAGHCWNNLVTIYLACGEALSDVEREAVNGLDFVRKLQFGIVIDMITGQLRLIRLLRGLTSEFTSFNDSEFDEAEFEQRLEANPNLALPACFYWVRKLQAHVLASDYSSALGAATKAQKLLWTSRPFFEHAEYHFYAGLARAASSNVVPAPERAQHLETLVSHHRQLEIWTQHCPENFEDRRALLAAEIARLEGRALDAERLYEDAIRMAHTNGFIHNEALANELASRFYAGRGLDKIARVYLQDARYGYLRWGADGKVRQLDEMYPHLRGEERAPTPTNTIGVTVEHLDLATVIKMSQAISGEIVLEKLVDTLMRTAIEQAGAERGLLIIPHGAEQRIAAEATTRDDSVVVQLRDQPVAGTRLPESALRYVLRTQETLILDNATAQNPFSADPYIHQHQARSILCLPLINQAKLIGVLYLENNLTAHVFTPTRITVLKLLASQAAISLENSRLYRELQEREARIRRLVDANIIGIFIWDLEGRIIEANDAFLHMVGYDREDLVSGRVHWADLTPAEWRERDKQAVAALKMAGTAQPTEKEYFRKDGGRVPVLVGAAAFGGGSEQGVAFVLDLTELKRAEAALHASEERWRAMFETAPVGITMRDFEHRRYLTANESFQRMIGYTGDELRHLTALDITHEDDRPAMQRRIGSGAIGVLQRKRYRRKDGEVIWADVTSFVVPSTDSTPTFLGAVIVDITERKRAEEALQQAQADLARLNRVMLLGEMTASIAHEVNQPISAVITNAHAGLRWLDARRPDLEEARQVLSRIVRDGNRAGDVIDRIRALVRKVPPRRDRSNINEAIHEVIALTQTEVERNGIRLQTRLGDELPLVPADRVQLQQVIMNLIVNAIEAMAGIGDSPRELTIASGERDANTVFVEVQDTGPGIDPADLDRLFQSFYTTKPEGIGMGLAISRSIVEAHGGTLSAAPNQPHGATFQFTVPARADGS
jgi:PAS domain S-box-containing protein